MFQKKSKNRYGRLLQIRTASTCCYRAATPALAQYIPERDGDVTVWPPERRPGGVGTKSPVTIRTCSHCSKPMILFDRSNNNFTYRGIEVENKQSTNSYLIIKIVLLL